MVLSFLVTVVSLLSGACTGCDLDKDDWTLSPSCGWISESVVHLYGPCMTHTGTFEHACKCTVTHILPKSHKCCETTQVQIYVAFIHMQRENCVLQGFLMMTVTYSGVPISRNSKALCTVQYFLSVFMHFIVRNSIHNNLFKWNSSFAFKFYWIVSSLQYRLPILLFSYSEEF